MTSHVNSVVKHSVGARLYFPPHQPSAAALAASPPHPRLYLANAVAQPRRTCRVYGNLRVQPTYWAEPGLSAWCNRIGVWAGGAVDASCGCLSVASQHAGNEERSQRLSN